MSQASMNVSAAAHPVRVISGASRESNSDNCPLSDCGADDSKETGLARISHQADPDSKNISQQTTH